MQNVKLFVVRLRKTFIYIVKIAIIDNIIQQGGNAFHAIYVWYCIDNAYIKHARYP